MPKLLHASNNNVDLMIPRGDVASVWTLSPIDKPLGYLVASDDIRVGSVVNLPFGHREILGVVWGIDQGSFDQAKLKPINSLSALPMMGAPMRKFIEKMAEFTITPIGQILKMALRVPAPLANPPKWLAGIADFDGRLTAKRQALFDLLMDFGEEGVDLRELEGFSRGVVNGLIDDGAARWVHPATTVQKMKLKRSQLALSAEQLAAVAKVREVKLPVLLKGVTGAGKTEVYFEAIMDAVAAGKQALVMLPEIALTDKFIERCAERFGVRPGHWHSDMSVTARRNVWNGVADGSVSIVIGARSSLFLPFQNLGLIVIDEEHDTAYKQEEGVTYHGRDMAVLRAHFEAARILMASATPSVESMHNAKSGKYELVEMHERFGDAVMPKMRIVDMRDAGLHASHWIAPEVLREMRARLDAGEQSLLFLNRRGFAPLTICRACGHQIGCPDCDARMVEHRALGRLQCHQCGLERTIPKACPECEVEDKLAPVGPGVERLAEEVREHFPEARISIMSSDLVNGETALRAEIAAITAGEYDVIIGTQMIAKGHNFPNLTLVGIVDADIGLEGGDLRAAERSFQLLRQVTGRAGRADKPGLAMVQSYQPESSLLAAILSSDDHRFYGAELRGREMASAPPFSRLVGIVISAPDLDVAMQVGRAMLNDSADLQAAGMRILGPVVAPISRIRGRARVRMLVKMPKALKLHALISDWRTRAKSPSIVKIAIDIDPQSFF